ncbi:hypothetical protein RF11_15750 [Thelohanellus kitauei]|uniref:Uncharacterized protein n=1 Tax=Thelohanellus kitauei TaxID=669202 RepID=A0A0C2IIU0_THEKT|nr:hypothetical protein RF11_15750 [Thelohanellus kitauei]
MREFTNATTPIVNLTQSIPNRRSVLDQLLYSLAVRFLVMVLERFNHSAFSTTLLTLVNALLDIEVGTLRTLLRGETRIFRLYLAISHTTLDLSPSSYPWRKLMLALYEILIRLHKLMKRQVYSKAKLEY